MANKSKAAHGSKATFVRANPAVAAPDLVKQAKQQGMTLTVGHVYNIRASDKAKGRSVASTQPSVSTGAGSSASATKTELPRLDAQLRTLILRIGLDRAEQLFSELKSSLSRLE